jgi:hypothetical protein
MMQRVVSGFNATIFAYGQTGSGKTYTMEGYEYNLENGVPRPNFVLEPSREGII